MIKLNKQELRDKIYACWLGKNIGGTLGTPFEGQQSINDCDGFTSEPGNPLPNDDLDLQLVWLKAFREVGAQNLDSKVLGEYWIEYVTPFWNEYGISKANMKRGIVPPVSGQYKNYWRHSNGAWIRTEIWASLYPGNVEKAIRYAYEDSSVDHGSGEGTYAAIFVAAVESAAFVIKDMRKLLEIGLSKIPSDCRMHVFVTKAIECFDSGMSWQDARQALAQMSLDDSELGWFQAPANVGYTVLALLYGNGDFKKTLLIACNCGDDTDCTCATAGSVLGIMHGMKIIPDDWREYIGDAIITKCINLGATDVPATCSALTDNVISLHTLTMHETDIAVTDGETDMSGLNPEDFMGNDFAMSLASRSDCYAEYHSILADCLVEYERDPEITANGSFTVKLSLTKRLVSQKVYTVKWFLPEGWSACGSANICVMDPLRSESAEYKITAGDRVDAKNMLVAAITCEGHFDTLTVPIVLLG